MEWFKPLENGLIHLVTITKFFLEVLSVLCVALGLFKTIQLALSLLSRTRFNYIIPFNQVRLRFGLWLALALEFQLGADILGTTIAPSAEELVRLALIATIRTFLNFFLGKELEAELELEKKRTESTREIF
jgi:uncharacterized membrane protein